SLRYCTDKARFHAESAKTALQVLPASPWKQALADLANYSVARNH
ncbi:MAG: hypothetical protein RLZZ456_285, partial [Pseudomonadota bacterium]